MSLIVTDITKNYPSRTGAVSVLNGCSFRLETGESLSITGPSGSGKSTLLSIIGTLQKPTSGTIELDGVNPFTLPPGKLSEFRRRHIGFVFQDHHLLPQCGALENVLIPLLAEGHIRPESVEKGKRLLNLVGLENRSEHRPAELSGGERQRVAIARSLINSPDLILADEPTGNLDRANASIISDLLLDIRNEHPVILIIVTHDPGFSARTDRQYRIGNP